MRRLIGTVALLAAAPAAAADRGVPVTGMTRLRVDAPVAVEAARGAPRVRLSGTRDAIEGVEVRHDGATLTLRRRAGSRTIGGGEPLRVIVSSTDLAAISVADGAAATADGLRAARVDLTVIGAGTLGVTGIDAGTLALVVAGSGVATLAGRAGAVRVIASGPVRLEAGGLEAGDLFLAVEGAGEIRTRARYTARVANRGGGSVVVEGTPKCTVQPGATGIVRCGVAP